MKEIFTCRRTGMAFYSITILGIALLTGAANTSAAIASIAIGLAGANSYEKSKTNNK